MIYKIEWTFRAEISFFEEAQFILQKWNIYEVNKFESLVENELKRLSIHPMIGNLKVDNIDVLIVNLPYTLPISQTGIWCQGSEDIIVKNFKVEREIPKAFVVMQFSSPFNELYQEVIKSVCEKFKLNVIRADETYGPGIILTDITKQINESRLIIAEITNPNPNVFYEVGYAHALNKPTILIAESGTKLPFDVSSFRTLFSSIF